MILFTILTLTLLFLITFMVLMVSAVGAGAVIIFGDVIVCVVFIVLIIRWWMKR